VKIHKNIAIQYIYIYTIIMKLDFHFFVTYIYQYIVELKMIRTLNITESE